MHQSGFLHPQLLFHYTVFYKMFAPALLTWLTLAIALTVNAEPLLRIRDSTISLPIAKRVNATSIGKIALRDKARAQAFIHGRSKLQPQVVGSIPATNQVVDYVVSVSDLHSFFVLWVYICTWIDTNW